MKACANGFHVKFCKAHLDARIVFSGLSPAVPTSCCGGDSSLLSVAAPLTAAGLSLILAGADAPHPIYIY
jgi:hypothetical protein